jgi:thiol-disulfide isomerase/thioredoxin
LFCAEPLLAITLSEIAPDFSLTNLHGRKVQLSALQGQNALLLFGATSCPHCDAALPILENLSQFLDDELKIFFIAVRESTDQVAGFFADKAPSYDILVDETGIISTRYGVKRVPTCIFIDEQGLVQHIGRPNEQVIWRLLSGERPIYPEALENNLPASARIARQDSAISSGTKRFIVEIDEEPKAAKKLSKAALQSRREQYDQAAKRISGRIIHNYGRLKNKIVIEIAHDQAERLKELPRFKSFKEDRRVYARTAAFQEFQGRPPGLRPAGRFRLSDQSRLCMG